MEVKHLGKGFVSDVLSSKHGSLLAMYMVNMAIEVCWILRALSSFSNQFNAITLIEEENIGIHWFLLMSTSRLQTWFPVTYGSLLDSASPPSPFFTC